MIDRRVLFQTACIGLIGLLPWRRVEAQQGAASNTAERLDDRNVVSLEDQLINGLRTTTNGQRAWVRAVVARVNSGQLPRAMVNLIYKWALRRNPKVPFPYFQYALRVLAKRRGIVVP